MLLSEHFTLEEMIFSSTAQRHGLDNTPPADAVANLKALCLNVLEPVRALWGGPIKVDSGYRSFPLNALVHGVPSSQHCLGQAADLVPPIPLEDAMKKLADSSIPFDQAILEMGWIHLSYSSRNRKEMLVTADGKHYAKWVG